MVAFKGHRAGPRTAEEWARLGQADSHPPPLKDADGPSEEIPSRIHQRHLHMVVIPWSALELALRGQGTISWGLERACAP